ncbi:hypothetical protein DFH27DRAFT_657235 [Peziza echinospora]|nr:hypothetical protein DFH27DRAFT_657235 [Peziza echinospora]
MTKWLYSPTSTDSEPSWEPSPRRRCTMDLFLSCSLTLVICFWTAIHLNIVPKGSTSNPLLKKLSWALIGIVAPEIVLCSALDQYMQARWVCEQLKEQFAENAERVAAKEQSRAEGESGRNGRQVEKRHSKESPGSKESGSATKTGASATKRGMISALMRYLFPLGMEQAFFIVMGGYGIENDQMEGEDGKKPREKTQVKTLTPLGAIALIKAELLSPLDLADVQDRSKADGLSKAIVCVQATWLVVQGLARRVAGLPVTLLELHTIVHVLCALGTFGLWMKKPQDVRTQHIVADRTGERALYLLMSLPVRGYIAGDRPFRPEMLVGGGLRPTQAQQAIAAHYMRMFGDAHAAAAGPDGSPSADVVRLADAMKGIFSGRIGHVRAPDADAERLAAARPRLNLSPWSGYRAPAMLRERAANLLGKPEGIYGSRDEWKVFKTPLGWVLLALNDLYGAIHLTAWHAHFPSNLERLLWRVSGCLILAVPAAVLLIAVQAHIKSTASARSARPPLRRSAAALPFMAIGLLISIPMAVPFKILKRVIMLLFQGSFFVCCCICFRRGVVKSYREFFQGYMANLRSRSFYKEQVCNWVHTASNVTHLLVALGFIFSRLFITVEVFISLRNLPAGAYDTVVWTQFFPHI